MRGMLAHLHFGTTGESSGSSAISGRSFSPVLCEKRFTPNHSSSVSDLTVMHGRMQCQDQ